MIPVKSNTRRQVTVGLWKRSSVDGRHCTWYRPQLFISFIKLHVPVGKQTFACWVKEVEVLTRSGIDTTRHTTLSTRAAGCSVAAKAGLLGWLVDCLTSQQHASASQGRICSDKFMCCHTEIGVADQTFHLTQSQSTDTGLTSPSTDPITPGAWQGSHWNANF